MAPLLKYGQNIFFAPDSVRWPTEDVDAWVAGNAEQHRIILATNETREVDINNDGTQDFFAQNIIVELATNSHLDLHINHCGTHITNITILTANLASKATMRCRETFASNESYHRLRTISNLKGLGANFSRTLVGKLNQQNRLDAETIVNHQASNTTSTLINRLVLDNDAKAIVRDFSNIPKGMKDSTCSQDSRALILSRTAEANMIPVLDISTDQVTASHAASVSRPNAEQIEFMTSRGLDPASARELAVEGFLNYGK